MYGLRFSKRVEFIVYDDNLRALRPYPYHENELFHTKRFGHAQLEFSGQVKGKDYWITILVVEDLPQIFIR